MSLILAGMKDIKYEKHEEKIMNGQTDKVSYIPDVRWTLKGLRKTILVVIYKDHETIEYKCIVRILTDRPIRKS